MYGQSLTSCWLKHIGTACVWCFCLQQWKKSSFFPVCKGVPRRQPHCRSGLATCPLWEPSPSHPVLLYTRGFAVFLCLLFDYCMFDFSVYYIYLQYFDTVGWVFWPVKTVLHIGGAIKHMLIPILPFSRYYLRKVTDEFLNYISTDVTLMKCLFYE